MDSPATSYPRSGPWKGIDEGSSPGTDMVSDGLNVVFRDGRVERRPGRQIVATDANGRRVAGLHEYVTKDGARRVVAFHDPAGANAGGVAKVNWGAQATEPVASPAGAPAVMPGHFTVAIPVDGHLILAEPSGTLLDFDGADVELLTAVQGIDAAIDSRAYLTAPPRATSLSMWRDRVVAAGAPLTPRLIGISENKWTFGNIPDEAPIGGPNVWPVTQNFDINTDDGDSVVAVSVLNDRLIVLGRSGIMAVDEDAIAPVAKTVARQHGAIAPRSVVNTGAALLYLGEKQIYAFDGTKALPVPGLERTLEDVIDWEHAHGAVAVNLRQATEYRLWVPVRGMAGNQLCLILNYSTGKWRKASHWYPFDVAARRELPYKFDVTAALSILLETGREVLITGDSNGRIWREDVGEDDQGQVFPAFIALPPRENGSAVDTYSDWSVDCLHDGSFVAGLAVADGRDVEQEILRVLNGELVGGAAEDQRYVIQRAISDGQQTWANVAAWPMQVVGPKYDELKLGLRLRARRVQPVLLLPGQSGGVIDPAPGAIRQLEVGTRLRTGRR